MFKIEKTADGFYTAINDEPYICVKTLVEKETSDIIEKHIELFKTLFGEKDVSLDKV